MAGQGDRRQGAVRAGQDDPNGYDLSYGGVRAKAHVFTAREAELAALMPEKKAADTSKKLLCPMPGWWSPSPWRRARRSRPAISWPWSRP